MADPLDIDAAKERLRSLEAEISRVRALLPQEKQRTSAPIVNCPACGAEMEPGTIAVKETLWGFLFVGASYQHLFFRGDGGKKDECLMTSGVPTRANRCPNCHTLLFRSRS